MRKWIKKWAPILLPIIISASALGVSIFSCNRDENRFQDFSLPTAQHTEINNELNRLDGRLTEFANDNNNFTDKNTDAYQRFIKAKDLRNNADIAWVKRDYGQAQSLIKLAFNALVIPTPPPLLHRHSIGGLLS